MLLSIAMVTNARAQSGPPAPVPDRSAGSPPGAATARPDEASGDRDSDDDALAMFRAPLLREGSHLVLAKATATRDARTGEWRLLVERADSGETAEGGSPGAGSGEAPRYEFTLLPCARLAEMQRIIESSPDHRVTFQVSGQVLVFRGRNYLLPTYTPVLGDEIIVNVAPAVAPGTSGATSQPASKPAPQTQSSTASSAPSAPGTSTTPASAPTSTAPADRSAQDISSELEKAAGPLRRSGGAPTRDQSAPAAATQNDANQSQPSGARNTPSSATRPPTRGAERRAAAATGHPDKLLREGTILSGRRGKLSRDGAGGWNFVFDADASGLADPPVRLLPCMLLERIEDYARRVGNNSPALLSGPVYLYSGRNYMLPTVFRIPQDRRNLTP